MLSHKKSKVCIVGLLGRILEAVSVNGNDSVCILVYDDSVGVHTEGSYGILKLGCSVYDL